MAVGVWAWLPLWGSEFTVLNYGLTHGSGESVAPIVFGPLHARGSAPDPLPGLR